MSPPQRIHFGTSDASTEGQTGHCPSLLHVKSRPVGINWSSAGVLFFHDLVRSKHQHVLWNSRRMTLLVVCGSLYMLVPFIQINSRMLPCTFQSGGPPLSDLRRSVGLMSSCRLGRTYGIAFAFCYIRNTRKRAAVPYVTVI